MYFLQSTETINITVIYDDENVLYCYTEFYTCITLFALKYHLMSPTQCYNLALHYFNVYLSNIDITEKFNLLFNQVKWSIGNIGSSVSASFCTILMQIYI